MRFEDFLLAWFGTDSAEDEAVDIRVLKADLAASAELVAATKEDPDLSGVAFEVKRRAFDSSSVAVALRLYRHGDATEARKIFENVADGRHPAYAVRAVEYLREMASTDLLERASARAVEQNVPARDPDGTEFQAINGPAGVALLQEVGTSPVGSVDGLADESWSLRPTNASIWSTQEIGKRAAGRDDRQPSQEPHPPVWIEDWAERAACREDRPDQLFVRGAEQNKAKAVCATCPVRTECLAEALDNEIEWGVWGGMTERERRALLRRRPSVSWRQVLQEAKQLRQDANAVSS